MHNDDYPRYDSEYTQYYHEVACGNSWARENSQDCGCGGRGWWLSQVDTWHQCPYHGKDVPHPMEEDYYNDIKDLQEVEESPKETYRPPYNPDEDDSIPF
jgi:hypothetical protein